MSLYTSAEGSENFNVAQSGCVQLSPGSLHQYGERVLRLRSEQKVDQGRGVDNHMRRISRWNNAYG